MRLLLITTLFFASPVVAAEQPHRKVLTLSTPVIAQAFKYCRAKNRDFLGIQCYADTGECWPVCARNTTASEHKL